MTHEARITCAASRDSLASLLRFIEEACANAALGQEEAIAVRMSVEELCENIIKYGYAGREPGPLTIEFAGSDDQVVVAVEDRGRPFDPRQAPPPDLTSDWDRRPLGGLGWHLVHKLMDEVRYEPVAEGGNRVTLVKRRFATT
jgi:anti-sigma regulatory factor (Ser/Thr protein kinase)